MIPLSLLREKGSREQRILQRKRDRGVSKIIHHVNVHHIASNILSNSSAVGTGSNTIKPPSGSVRDYLSWAP
jgi:hypothetical protein